jgi:hypothetical protein
MQCRIKTATQQSHKTHRSRTKTNHHDAPTETKTQHVHKNRGTTVELSYSAGTQISGIRLQATREATRRLIHSSSATSAKKYKFIVLSVTIK